MKKFSGKTLEENKEEEGSEPPKVETREVRLQAGTSPRRLCFFRFLWKSANAHAKAERMKSELRVFWWRLVMSELKRSFKSLALVLCLRSFSALLDSVL